MQTAIQHMPQPHYASQLSHRPQYLPHKSINSTMTRMATTNGLPLPVPTPPVARKRKRPLQYSVSYSEVQEVDNDGRLREVIVIEDTPPPPATISPAMSSSTSVGAYSVSMQPPLFGAPVRTRARAAQESQDFSTSTSSSSGLTVPALKKRKREPELSKVVQAKKALSNAKYAQTLATNGPKSWNNGIAAPTNSGTTTAANNAAAGAVAKTHAACDDKEGHYIVNPGDMIYRRYRIIRQLGQGTFGKVVEALDITNEQRVAVKIIRAVPKYRDASKIEVRVLQKLKERDPLNKNKCIHLLHWFDHRNHICLVSELLGMCVYDFLKENDFQPFPRRHIQDFARQLLGSVAYLHDLHLVHTDLKPENILLAYDNYQTITFPSSKRGAPPKERRILMNTDIRLIDFGSATFEAEYHSTVVSTRHYRAPEIILGLGWSYPCDVFSLGCILVEFYTGVALFQTHDNLEHLAMMEMVLGVMPERFARSGARSKPELFKDTGRLNWPPPKTPRQTKRDMKNMRTLRDLLQPRDQINQLFLDLVQRLLAFDPSHRITVRDALRHPYFSLSVPMDEF